jgi:hypothetical protein
MKETDEWPPAGAGRGATSLPRVRWPGWDAFVVAILTIALLQITSLAEELALPTSVQDVLRHPWLGQMLPQAGVAAMGEIGPRPRDPIGLLLIAFALAGLGAYLLVDLTQWGRWRLRLKWLLLVLILAASVYLPALKLMALRAQSGPASYAHDGGVIQTEVTIQYLLEGKNPYIEEYVDTPMAEWGFSEYRTALYHYPYLPWTFLFSAPFYLLGQAVGWYDQRVVYLLLMAVALVVAARLVQGERTRLAMVAALALNPVMALDLIFGQNDAFILCWLIFSLGAWQQWRRVQRLGGSGPGWLLASTLFLGLACASKPTAWFFAPFYGLLLLPQWEQARRDGFWLPQLLAATPRVLARVWPGLALFALILLPYLIWDAYALYEDVWRWSTGQGETGYQIWGWGASNFVLALGLVENRFGQWPFWLLELLIAAPILIWFTRRQWYSNTLPNACWHYGIFLLCFFYSSRFLNENYLGYILAFLAIGILYQVDYQAGYQAGYQVDTADAKVDPPLRTLPAGRQVQ